jgi:divalent metal cation (Fe/Co/Zn/Cd) transporter
MSELAPPRIETSSPDALASVDHARAALRVSAASLLWTLLAGAAACAIGALGNSLVLISFGAISLLDAAGSTALVVHFRHSLRHEVVSERHERFALRVVIIGMFVIGLATAAESVHRLVTHTVVDAVAAGVVLAGLSVVVLATLAFMKRRVAPLVGSHALHADGWLSATGSLLALVTLAGTGFSAALGWTWVDAAAATIVACGAMALSVVLGRAA